MNKNINDPDIDIDPMFELCVCGDYRHNHENGKGKCRMPNDITHGYQECKKFKRSL